MNPKINLDQRGAAQAALLSAMLGMLALAFVNLGAEISQTFQAQVHKLGKLWMPGAEGIGPYSGKETAALLVWLASWFFLHRVLRNRQWNHQLVTTIFLIGIACATTLLWPPVYTALSHR